MIEMIQRPRIETEELSNDNTYGRFMVEPLERGFGTTLGNSLRRVLLSSLPGVAPKSIKIDGVVHEFSTIPGVKEDVTEIVLNIKGLIAKLHCEGPKTVEISAEGPCIVTADSIKCDSEVEILNPDLHIATLGEGAKLYMEIVLDEGRGYVSGERNKQNMPQGVIGELAVDSIYTPVLKVNFNVEPARVGQRIDFDKLTLEVWTNGVITAQEAVSLAAKILTDQLNLFVDLSEKGKAMDTIVEKSGSDDAQVLKMTIEELRLMHSMKTGALLKASVLLGAFAGKKTPSQHDLSQLEVYGNAIGLAFQIVDDILDVVGDTAELGKTAGKDALGDKPTYVSLLGLEKAKELAEEQYLIAAKAVEGLSEDLDGKERLIEIADFIIKRTH